MSVFNLREFDHTKQPMFFGESVNVSRTDIVRHQKLVDLIDKQESFFWRPTEVDLTKDKTDFELKLTDAERHIFTSNIKYQSLLDSVQGRAPSRILGPIASLPEVEAYLDAWNFFETIHNRSYMHILRNVYPDPSVVLDSIIKTPEIVERAKAIDKYFSRLENFVYDRDKFEQYEGHENAKYDALFDYMVCTYGLEGIRFYVSFACAFAFNERELMEGNAKIIKLIARDEHLHQGGSHFMLTRWQRGLDDPEMSKAWTRNFHRIKEILLEIFDQEQAWASYLFQHGSMIGLNERILVSYLKWLTQQRYNQLVGEGAEELFEDVPTSNPLPWMTNYLESDNVQLAPQETELSSYLTGAVSNDLKAADFSDFEL